MGCIACCLCIGTVFLLMIFFGVPLGGKARTYVAPGSTTKPSSDSTSTTHSTTSSTPSKSTSSTTTSNTSAQT